MKLHAKKLLDEINEYITDEELSDIFGVTVKLDYMVGPVGLAPEETGWFDGIKESGTYQAKAQRYNKHISPKVALLSVLNNEVQKYKAITNEIRIYVYVFTQETLEAGTEVDDSTANTFQTKILTEDIHQTLFRYGVSCKLLVNYANK